MRLFSLALLTIALSASLLPSLGFAQRGQNYHDSTLVIEGPSQGYPGFFDSNLVKKGGFALDLPTAIQVIPTPISSFDYGLSNSTTIGTNPVYLLGGFALGGYALNLKIRTLVYGTSAVQSVVTFYGGYLRAKGGDSGNSDSDLKDLVSDEIGTQHLYAVSNTSWYITPYSILTGQVALGTFGILTGKPGSINHMDISATNLFLGGGYQFFWSPRMGVETSGMFPVFSKLSLDSTGGAVSLQSQDLDASNALFYLARVSYVLKVRESWLMNMGLALVGSGISVMALPWYGAAVQW